MPNRLAHESSPYLLQHQNNPVDWYPWGEEALTRAQTEQKPIFLSIGYSACHWCHVMEHESFENPQIAALMNEHFVNVKVDREERPDLDAIYMQAVQMMTRRGGWPMSVFLTPDLQPFYGGTYWPPTGRQGMPGFDQVLLAVSDAWTHRRAQAREQATEITKYLQEVGTNEPSDYELSEQLLRSAEMSLANSFDPRHGGFGQAPKFPHPMDLRLLLRLHARNKNPRTLQMVTHTLDKMMNGGIYDHLGGGFARYSVDERWLVPHFEKMLYDNAQLAACFIEANQVTNKLKYAAVACEICDYVLRDMTDKDGAFYSTEDADSEGHEGKFYVWTPAELEAVLGKEEAELFAAVYDVTSGGNFEHGTSILNLPRSLAEHASERGIPFVLLQARLTTAREKLFLAREQRIHPGKDDKVIVAWNGLMIDALALVGSAMGEPKYLDAARKAADFLWANLRREDGHLFHTWRHGKAKLAGYLDDYTALANGLVSLFEATGDVRYLEHAIQLMDVVLERFSDPAGGFFFTADDHEALLVRHKDLQDNAVPSGNSLAATVLLRLAKLTGREDFRRAAIGTIRAGQSLIERYPSAAGQLLLALDYHLGPTPEVVLVGDRKHDSWVRLAQGLRTMWLPRRALIIHDTNESVPDDSPLAELLRGKTAINDEPTLYICEGFTCQAPVVGEAAIMEALKNLSQA
jgi:uncharacterized protein YyaL (SSP411 family)